ncbi:signal transduction histidine kinase [Scopulibacillus darangshiensis]|uniref:histidine kinase n=1 Tax=Scopulibacillus darangshiensis TaxID=442528 RepID=A0A4R2NSX5_9BACL|nr:HAMP domain-containing sensor histidine kinase [Scopulibacillus darangshiensis]TCP24947.1 signal transduction histidine kinase [Scopulibacillus darangshiensis]
MKPLKIRQWMFVGLLIILTVPRLFYEIPGLLDRYVFEQPSEQRAELKATLRVATANPAKWHNKAWQADLRKKSEKSDVGILILDSSDRVIFRSGPIESEKKPKRQATVVDGDHVLGRVLLFAPDKGNVLPTVIAAIAAICAFLFIGFKMGRYVVKPLEAMGKAARRIAGGDLDFDLPKSSAAEVEDVRAAFQAMGQGLRESIARQSKLEEERRLFIGAIAHDLRSPLFVLRGFLTRLEKGLASDPEKIARYAAICGQKAEQLDRLVSDLFSYTKMDYMEQTLRKKQLEMGPLMDEVVDDFLPLARAKDVVIAYDSPSTVCTLQGDGDLLRRVFANLLDNAIRYTPAEGKIDVGWHMDKDQFVFTVEDTGPGISEHDLPHLFEPFYRAEGSRNRETGGTGLGLTIAKRILRAHGGDLIAGNRTSGGAVFTGWLELCQAPQ